MRLIEWDMIPNSMKNDEVRYYYEILRKKRFQLNLKRIFDVILSLLLIVISLPIMLGIGIVIKLTDNGDVFYRQTRITQYGKEFRILKFRTMVMNADKIGSEVTVGNDPRVTKIGSKIRKIRLDELPQLFNVLLGDMTFVGTRPEVKRYVDMYTNDMRATLLLPAGITSKASINFKNEEKLLNKDTNVDSEYISKILPIKMKYNLEQLRRFSFFYDIKIMVRTFIEVMK